MLSAVVRKASEHDSIFFFFSGHVTHVIDRRSMTGEVRALIPYDAGGDLQNSMLIPDLLEQLEGSAARAKIFMTS